MHNFTYFIRGSRNFHNRVSGSNQNSFGTFLLSSHLLIIQRVQLLLEGIRSVPAFLRAYIATCNFSKGRGDLVRDVFSFVFVSYAIIIP